MDDTPPTLYRVRCAIRGVLPTHAAELIADVLSDLRLERQHNREPAAWWEEASGRVLVEVTIYAPGPWYAGAAFSDELWDMTAANLPDAGRAPSGIGVEVLEARPLPEDG